jgi:hypothetical protein
MVRFAVRLYFKPADLLLEEATDGTYVVKMGGQVIGTFKRSSRAISEYNRLKRTLEEKMPPPEVSDGERRELLQRYIADTLVADHSSRPTRRKSSARNTRTFG